MPPRKSKRLSARVDERSQPTSPAHTSPDISMDNTDGRATASPAPTGKGGSSASIGTLDGVSASKIHLGPIPEDISFAALAEIIPDASFESPTPDTIVRCYKLILEQHEQLDARIRQIEEVEAANERRAVEYDQNLQDHESTVMELEKTIETAQSESQQARRERDELASECSSLQNQLSRLNTSQSSSSSELDNIKRRLEDAEREKRDLLVVVGRLKDDASQREEEIQTLRESLKQSRKDQQHAESEARELKSSEASAKFKLETVAQQLKMAKEETERAHADLTKKIEESSKDRREKHAELAQLRSSLDAITHEKDQVQSSLRSLQNSHSSQNHQLSQALQKVQDLTGQLADQEAKYSSEATNLRRLVDMLKERETQAKAIVENLEKDWDGEVEKAAAREQELRDQLQQEQHKADSLEKQLENLQLVIDRISSGELPLPPPGERHTPRIDVDDDTSLLRSFSPGLAMINRMQKSGKTFTEVYADYVHLQEELKKRNIEYDRMNRTLSEVLAQIEERAPILAEQRRDYERVQAEALQLSTQLTQALGERSEYLSRIQDLDQKYLNGEKENGLLQQQLNDLGLQVQSLLKEIARLNDPTLPPDAELREPPADASIDDIITDQLLLFTSIPALQQQNQRLIKITRELGAQMAASERAYKERLEQEQVEAIREAHEAIQALQLQLETQQKSQQVTIQAYIKERATLKALIARKDLQSDASVILASSSFTNGVEISHQDDFELSEVQNDFDIYRRETAVDSAKLREELDNYQREASQLGAALAKANAKIEFLTDRQRMLQEQYTIRSQECNDMATRNQQLYDRYTRLDIACNHASEELATTSAQLEQLRSECANLRAEKSISESVLNRLTEENKSLVVERSRLSDLIGNVQKLHNDLDRSNENDRRRLEIQIQTLEAQAGDLRSQLTRDRDSISQVTLQKDVETRELRSKLESTSEQLAKARESFVAADTSSKHLQDRVDDLLKQSHMNAEKLAVYERRNPSTRNIVSAREQGGTHDVQLLESEIAELRAALKAAEVDLEASKAHVQQFQEISQASETALANLTNTHEEYKSSTEAQMAKQESIHQDLHTKIAAVQSDLTHATQRNDELQKELDVERAEFASEKKTLEGAILDITNMAATSKDDKTSWESEIREQEARAKLAENKYSREVVAHAESIKLIENIKTELEELRISTRAARNAADTAQAKFTMAESSWKLQRDALEKEITDLQDRCKDLISQNEVLHQHLETVNMQAAQIRRTADQNPNVSVDSDNVDAKYAELRSVIGYLRKEKEIVDLQLELSKQEGARFKSQVEHLNQSLNDLRNTLTQERERAAESLENSTQHAELLERINQLNILRESNATLRAESDAHARRARQLQTSLTQISSELEPLKEELRVTKAELQEKDRQFDSLRNENRQWKERSEQLLTKYDRIDPKEMESLKEEVERLKSQSQVHEEEKAQNAQALEAKQKMVDGISSNLSDFRTKYQNLLNESRTRIGQINGQTAQLRATVADLQKQIKAVTAERDQLKAQPVAGVPSATAAEVELLQAQIQALSSEKATLEKSLADTNAKLTGQPSEESATIVALRQERDQLLAEKEVWTKTQNVPNGSPDVAAFAAGKLALQKSLEEALAKAKDAEDRATKAANDLRDIRFQNEKFQTKITEIEKRRLAEAERQAALIETLKREQQQAVTEATNKLRAELQQPGSSTDEVTSRHQEEMRALEARLVAKYDADLKSTVEAASKETASEATAFTSSEEIAKRESESRAAGKREGLEAGRKEGEAKLKLRESMLAKSQANVKQLEAQIKAWRDVGITLPDVPVAAGQAPPPPATPVASAASHASASATPIPRKPSINVPVVQIPPKPASLASAVSASAAGSPVAVQSPRGVRGGVRGVRGMAVRGTPRGGAPGRGGVPQTATVATTPALSGAVPASFSAPAGMSIMGAAAKRTLEDPTTSESLTKRLKPAEGGPAKPVQLRRPPGPTTPQS